MNETLSKLEEIKRNEGFMIEFMPVSEEKLLEQIKPVLTKEQEFTLMEEINKKYKNV